LSADHSSTSILSTATYNTHPAICRLYVWLFHSFCFVYFSKH